MLLIAGAIRAAYFRRIVGPAMPFPPPCSGREYPMRGAIHPPCTSEAPLNQKVKNLIQKLGEAIHESVSESEDIAVVVRSIREQGFDVLLMLEATIGLNEVEEEAAADQADTSEVAGPFTNNDLSFLKSLRISVSEDDASKNSVDDV